MSKLSNLMRPLAIATCLALLAACSHGKAIIIDQNPNDSFLMMQTTAGNVLSTPSGMTLYTFDKDVTTASTCTGDCAQMWPPFIGGAGAQPGGFLTLFDRGDGTKQWAANGKPLYTYAQDKKPGEVKGDNFHNVWHVVKVQQ